MVGVTTARDQARRDLVGLVHRRRALPDFTRSATRALRRAVPFDGTCLLTLDPATLLPTGEVVENALPSQAMIRLTEIELGERDYNKFTALAHGPRSAASLSHVTAGDLDRSLRQRELRRPSGFADELRTVLSDATGTWGALTLLRERPSPYFTAAEVRFVASVAGLLAEGLRRSALLDATTGSTDEGDAGLLVLGADDAIQTANRAADRWIDELGGSGAALPLVVHAVAGQARATLAGDERLARARVRASSGRWVLVRASLLGDAPLSPVAVMIEAARAPDLAPMIAAAYGLRERERRVTELVAQGLSTHDIADLLHVSTYTVQDHLKAIFEKTGTRSRGDLVARLYFVHYAPRLTSDV